MPDLTPSGRINLRCKVCGELRTPLISPYFPDDVVVICWNCVRRSGDELMREPFLLEPEPMPVRKWAVEFHQWSPWSSPIPFLLTSGPDPIPPAEPPGEEDEAYDA